MPYGFRKEKEKSYFSKYVDWKEMKEFSLTSPGIARHSGQGTQLAHELGKHCFQKLHTRMMPHEFGIQVSLRKVQHEIKFTNYIVKKMLIKKKGDLALIDNKTFYKTLVIRQCNYGTEIN